MPGEKKWSIPPYRFLPREEIQVLRNCARDRVTDGDGASPSRILERIVIEIALGSGLRVAEIADLQCGDLALGKNSGSLVVRKGKGGKRRTVIVSSHLCRVLGKFLRWKVANKQSTGPSAPLLKSRVSGGALSTRALQKMFSRVLSAAQLGHHRFHDLRHTYGSHLLSASDNDLVFVRDQLGHYVAGSVMCRAAPLSSFGLIDDDAALGRRAR